MRIARIPALLALILLLASCGNTSDPIISTGRIALHASDYRTLISVIPEDLRVQLAENPDLLREYVLDIHSNASLAQRAVSEGLDDEPQVAAKLRQAREGFLAKELLVRAQAQRAANFTDDVEIAKEYYLANPSAFRVGETRRVAHILISPANQCGSEEQQTFEERVETVKKLLDSGEAFEAVAARYSNEAASAQKGGELKFAIARDGQTVKPFEDAVFELKTVGQISAPVVTKFGVHFIQLLEVTPAYVPDFETVKENAVALVRGKAIQRAAELLRGEEYPDLARIDYAALVRLLQEDGE